MTKLPTPGHEQAAFAIFLWAYYGHPDRAVQRKAVMRFENGNLVRACR